MVFESEPTISMPHQSAFHLTLTLTFDLLTSKSNQFIFVTNCTDMWIWWNFHKHFMRHQHMMHSVTVTDSLETECLRQIIASAVKA